MTKKNFDDILKEVGEFGKYQKTRLFLICLFGIVCAFHALNMVFVGAKPEFWCEPPSINLTGVDNTLFANTTTQELKHLLLSEETCERYDENEVKELLLNENITLEMLQSPNGSRTMVICDKWTYSNDVYGPTITSQFDLVCSNDWLRSTSKTLYFFGRLLGAVVFGQVSDMYGRKPTLFLCLLMLLIAGSVASASPNIYVFIPFYILQGAGQTGLFLVTYTMGTELVGPSYRLFAGFLAQSFYSIGFMSLAGIAYAIKDWRYIELAITLPVLLFIPCFWILPESVRWLVSKRKEQEAMKILRNVAAINNKSISQELSKDLSKLEEKTETKKFTLVDLCRPGILFLSLNVWFSWQV